MIEQGWSVRQVARRLGFTHSAVVKWIARARVFPRNSHSIPTRSSRPHTHPQELPRAVVSRILTLRSERNQCAELLHHRLSREDVFVSLSSVKRVLRRAGVSRYSRWKKWHQYPERPLPENPGVLVEIDTIHDGPHDHRLYVYTLLDVCSRWAYAEAFSRLSGAASVSFVRSAGKAAPFPFRTMQSDHGPEFGKWFTKHMTALGMVHRHSRVRTPNDNAHLERFNRTLQEECLNRVPRDLRRYRTELTEYLRYYNTERPHMGLKMRTPMEIVKAVPSY